jgi:hypothetical protein
MAVPIAEGADSHRRVDPSTSVNKNVTVPDGPLIAKVSHAVALRAPTPYPGALDHRPPQMATRAIPVSSW